jgi:hypothetical protein
MLRCVLGRPVGRLSSHCGGGFRMKSSAASASTPLAERLAQRLSDCSGSSQRADRALSDVVDCASVQTDIVYRSRFVVVECNATLRRTDDPQLLRVCAGRLAYHHARALRDSNADLTNMRDQVALDSAQILRGCECLTIRTIASVYQERFATIEYKVCTEASGPLVLWGSAVYRLWAPASD